MLPGACGSSREAQASVAENIRPLIPAAAMIGSMIETMLRMVFPSCFLRWRTQFAVAT
ncbi:hypothetical protein [Novosphingobium sp.]|uniref:hypothetical protein n=1 Tax=Novosphingobium sp. TaxID=1874826 RepID=UPI0035AEB080